MTMRTQKQIDDVKGKALAAVEAGESSVPGMSYEEGVLAALDWLDGTTDDDPMEG